jgi:hypothetical protein
MLLLLGSFLILLIRVGALERQLCVTYISNRAIYAALFALLLTCILISLGPTAPPGKVQLSLFSLLYYTTPGFSAVRAISRIAFPALLTGAILVGLGTWQLQKWFQITPRLVFIFFFLILAENAVTNFALEPRDGALAVVEKLQEVRKPHEAVVFLPMTNTLKPNKTVKSWKNFALRNVDAMNWAVDHDLLIVNGYSGQRTNIMMKLPGLTAEFPDPRSLDALSRIANLRYVVFSARGMKDFNPIQFQAQYEHFSPALELLAKDKEGGYLFSYNGQTRLSPQHTVRAPSHLGNGVLSFLVNTPYSKEEKSIALTVEELDHSIPSSPKIKRIPATGEWEKISFPLPEQTNPALPFRFQITSPSMLRVPIKGIMVERSE